MKKFDKEYATQFIDEVKFLKNKGIKYEFVKSVNGIDIYKYTKTKQLFLALYEFYNLLIDEG